MLKKSKIELTSPIIGTLSLIIYTQVKKINRKDSFIDKQKRRKVGNKTMYHLVLDLEMCKVPKHYRSKDYKYANEIIQIGAVLMDEEFEVIGKLNQYVHPEHGVLDFYISNLTGIESKQLKNAPLLEEALEHLIAWLGDREYKVYQWSNSDHKQLVHEIKSKGIAGEAIDSFMNEDRWVDYQAVFGKRYDFS